MKTLFRRALVVPVLATAMVGFTGCASATKYAPQSAEVTQGENGYTSQQLAADRYRVSFSGNKFTSREKVERFLLFRAAELTAQKGYDGFRVVRENTDRTASTDINVIPRPGVTPYYNAFSPHYNFYGSAFGSYTYDPYLGAPFINERVTVDQIERFDATAVIEMFRGVAVVTDVPTFNASQVIERVGPVDEPEM